MTIDHTHLFSFPPVQLNMEWPAIGEPDRRTVVQTEADGCSVVQVVQARRDPCTSCGRTFTPMITYELGDHFTLEPASGTVRGTLIASEASAGR